MISSTVFDCKLVTLPTVKNRSGNITPIHGGTEIPFDIERVYYLYDIPSGEERGGHAHKELKQLVVSVSGAFEVELYDGVNSKTFLLNRPGIGLYLVPGIWRELKGFSGGSVCLVLASQLFDEADYMRNKKDFKSYKKIGND